MRARCEGPKAVGGGGSYFTSHPRYSEFAKKYSVIFYGVRWPYNEFMICLKFSL